MTRKTSRNSAQAIIRFPDGLKERVQASAERNRRTLNSEIMVILEAHFGLGPHAPEAKTAEA